MKEHVNRIARLESRYVPPSPACQKCGAESAGSIVLEIVGTETQAVCIRCGSPRQHPGGGKPLKAYAEIDASKE